LEHRATTAIVESDPEASDWFYWEYPAGNPNVRRPTRIIAQRSVDTESHQVSNLGKGGDVGGPFFSYKQSYKDSGTGPYTLKGYLYLSRGKVYATSGSFSPTNWPVSVVPTPTHVLHGLGTTAIARTVPTNPVAGAAVALGELREGLPSLIGSSLLKPRMKQLRDIQKENADLAKRGFKNRKSAKNFTPTKNAASDLGKENLNLQFAVKPLLSDLRKFAHAVQQEDKILEQLRRDSSRVVRRRYEFPDEVVTTETVTPGAFCTAGLSYYYGSKPRELVSTTTTTTKTWFSGAYTYYVPEPGTIAGALAEANKLYGTRLTLDTAWNLAPWSWALDWFTNTGDVVKNITAFTNDGLVLRYGYIMRHTKKVRTDTWRGSLMINGVDTPVETSQSWTAEVRQRVPASPYGFGVDELSLSPRQLGIIASLGLTARR
jgi:hypothetical protein